MYEHLNKETQADLLKLGLYQIFGGGIGGLLIILFLVKGFSFTVLSVIFVVISLSLFAYSIYCGTLCINEKRNCLKYSLINQFAQLIGFSFLSIAFQYAAGAFITIDIAFDKTIDFSMGLGISKVVFNINSYADSFEVRINVVALLLIVWIDKIIRRLKIESEYRKIAEIGYN